MMVLRYVYLFDCIVGCEGIMGATGAWIRGEMERCSWCLWHGWGYGELEMDAGDGCGVWFVCDGWAWCRIGISSKLRNG